MENERQTREKAHGLDLSPDLVAKIKIKGHYVDDKGNSYEVWGNAIAKHGSGVDLMITTPDALYDLESGKLNYTFRQGTQLKEIDEFWKRNYDCLFGNRGTVRSFLAGQNAIVSGIVGPVMEEAFRRTKNALTPKTEEYSGNPEAFYSDFESAFHKQEVECLKEAKSGKLKIEERVKRVLDKIPDGRLEEMCSFGARRESSMEDAFSEAESRGDYARARTILDGIEAVRNWKVGQPISADTIGLFNCEVSLASKTGNIGSYLNLVRHAKRADCSVVHFDGKSAMNSLQELVSNSVLDTLEIEGNGGVIEVEGDRIRRLYCERLFSLIFDEVVKKGDKYDTPGFIDFVRRTAMDVGNTVSCFYPTKSPVKVKPRFKGEISRSSEGGQR